MSAIVDLIIVQKYMMEYKMEYQRPDKLSDGLLNLQLVDSDCEF